MTIDRRKGCNFFSMFRKFFTGYLLAATIHNLYYNSPMLASSFVVDHITEPTLDVVSRTVLEVFNEKGLNSLELTHNVMKPWWRKLTSENKIQEQLNYVHVDNVDDLAKSNCKFFDFTGLCSLRGAWELCSTSAAYCIIILPVNKVISFDISRGPLVLREGISIEIVGNGATVKGRYLQREWMNRLKLFTQVYYDPARAVAKKKMRLQFNGCSGMQFIFSACNNATTGDTLLNLYHENYQIDYSNSACGFRSMVVYTIPYKMYGDSPLAECFQYDLDLGCYEDEECKMRLDGYYVLRNESWQHQFIYFDESSVTNSAIGTELVLSNFSVNGFGSISTDGGALSIHGPVRVFIFNMNFTDNIGYRGGAVGVLGGASIVIQNSYFSDNQALFTGGSIFVSQVAYGSSLIEQIEVKNSSSVFDSGGAIGVEYVVGMLIKDILAYDCYCTLNGGSIYINQSFGINVSGVKLANSRTVGAGGGIYSGFSRSITLLEVQIVNSSSEVGGGIIGYMSMDVVWNNISIINSHVTQYGGATFCLGCVKFVATHIYTEDSSGLIGGGSGFYAIMDASIQYLSIKKASAQLFGGGIYINGASGVIFEDIVVNFGEALSGYGGGIYLRRGSAVTFLRNTVLESSAYTGGGLFIGATENLDLVSFRASRCSSVEDGGGLYIDDKNFYINIVEVTLTDNYAGQNGGGVYVASNNQYLTWLDLESYTAMNTFSATNSSEVKTLSFPGALGVILYFDETTLFNADWSYCCTRLLIYGKDDPYDEINDAVEFSASDTANLVFSGHYGVDLPGVDLAPMITNFTNLLIDYHNYDGFEKNSVKLYLIPIYGDAVTGISTKTTPNFLKSTFGPYQMVELPIDSQTSTIIGRSEQIHGVCRIENNVAYLDGGGIMISHVNPVFVSLNILLASNQALTGNGGGMLLETANIKSLLVHNIFKNNTAHGNGGGIFVGFSHYATNFRLCVFDSNFAGGYGGGKYVSSNNGMGTLDSGNELNCSLCTFLNNVASLSGGALYLEDQNGYLLSDSKLIHNMAITGDGGAIVMGSRNELTLDDSLLLANKAGNGCGGGFVVLSEDNSISIVTANISRNHAKSGGGICIKANTDWQIADVLQIIGNTATDAGGGCLLSSSSFWNISSGEVIFDQNSAERGSALFLHNIPEFVESVLWSKNVSNRLSNGSTSSIQSDENNSSGALNQLAKRVTFTNNRATRGTTIYWVYHSQGMNHFPIDFNSIGDDRWYNNYDSYGTRVGTQPVKIKADKQYNITSYGQQSLNPPLLLEILDHLDQVMKVSGDPYFFSIEIESHNCKSNSRPYIAGAAAVSGGVIIENGTGTVEELRAFCYPEGWMELQFTLPINPIDSVFSSSGITSSSFFLTHNTTMYFRGCKPGEYVANGICVVCGNGTFRLDRLSSNDDSDESNICESCIGTTGIASCYGAKIYLDAGYWRRYSSSKTVLPCLLGSVSCPGGPGTGDDACALGYAGPLCASCADGYYLSSGTCFQCGETNFTSMSILVMIFTALLVLYCILLLVAWCYKDVSFEHKPLILRRVSKVREWIQDFFGEVMVKVKIVVATFQVVISTADVFNVVMPGRFATFARSFNVLNLNIGSLIPFSCAFKHFNYNFMFRLFWATISPLLLVVTLLIALFVEGYVLRPRNLTTPIEALSGDHSLEADFARKERDEKAKKYDNEIKGRYINYIFYLTYLILPSVTTTIFKIFVCENIDPNNEDENTHDSYLVADVNISCTSDYYYRWRMYGIIMIAVYPVGIPLFYWVCLYVYRHQIENRSDPKRKHGHSNHINGTSIASLGSLLDSFQSPAMSRVGTVKRVSFYNDVPPHHDGRPHAISSPVDRHLIQPNHNMSTLSLNIHDIREYSQSSVDTPPTYTHTLHQHKSNVFVVTSSGKHEVVVIPQPRLHRAPSTASLKESMGITVMRISFLWEAYKPEYWYWELVETTRRILLTAVLSIYSTGTTEQTVVGIIMAFIFMKIYSHFDPYVSDADSKLAELGQTQIVATYFAAVVISAQLVRRSWNDAMGGVLIALNLSVIILGFYFEISAYLSDHPKEKNDGRSPFFHWFRECCGLAPLREKGSINMKTIEEGAIKSDIAIPVLAMPPTMTNTATCDITVPQGEALEDVDTMNHFVSEDIPFEETKGEWSFDVENDMIGGDLHEGGDLEQNCDFIDIVVSNDVSRNQSPVASRSPGVYTAVPQDNALPTPETVEPRQGFRRYDLHIDPRLSSQSQEEQNRESEMMVREESMESTMDYDTDYLWQNTVGAQSPTKLAPLEIIL